MKVVILAGGPGTRITEESEIKPKPLIEIGEMPIIWHIMKEYSYYGFNDFVICAGHKQHMIKEWFADYFLYTSDVTFDLTNDNKMIVHNKTSEPWKVTIVNTGKDTRTAGRVKRIVDYLDEGPFMLTYGDGVCDVDIQKLYEYHKQNDKLLTITAVKSIQEKGVLEITNDNTVKSFREKSSVDSSLINAGYMVVEKEVLDYIKDDNTSLESDVITKLVEEGKVGSYIHEGYWQCMDTIREKMELERLWQANKALWKKW